MTGFNPKARWDRQVPQKTSQNDVPLQENIQVLAFFNAGNIKLMTATRTKRKLQKVDPVLQSRIKNFYRLANRYVAEALTPNNVLLPWVFEFHYEDQEGNQGTEQLVVHTNSLPTAIMAFEAVHLERQRLITVLAARFLSRPNFG